MVRMALPLSSPRDPDLPGHNQNVRIWGYICQLLLSDVWKLAEQGCRFCP
jgi:hypothetical protein